MPSWYGRSSPRLSRGHAWHRRSFGGGRHAMRTARSIARLVMTALVLLGAATSSLAQSSLAQAWPQRTVKWILPFGAGSGIDIGARMLADPLAARWGKS